MQQSQEILIGVAVLVVILLAAWYWHSHRSAKHSKRDKHAKHASSTHDKHAKHAAPNKHNAHAPATHATTSHDAAVKNHTAAAAHAAATHAATTHTSTHAAALSGPHNVPAPPGCTECGNSCSTNVSGCYYGCPNGVGIVNAQNTYAKNKAAVISAYRVPKYDPVEPSYTIGGHNYWLRGSYKDTPCAATAK